MENHGVGNNRVEKLKFTKVFKVIFITTERQLEY